MTKIKLNFLLAVIFVFASGFTCQKKYPTAKPSEPESAEPAETTSGESADSAEPSSTTEETKSSSDN